MRTVRTKVYKFSELSKQAQEKAIEANYDINLMDDWYEQVYEDAANVGLKITGFDLDRGSYCKGDFNLSACEVAQNIFNQHGEHCETYKTAQAFMEEWQPVYNDYLNEDSENYETSESEQKLQDMEEDFLKSLLEDYRIMLQRESDYMMSEEAIIETFETNEYEFTQDGKMY